MKNCNDEVLWNEHKAFPSSPPCLELHKMQFHGRTPIFDRNSDTYGGKGYIYSKWSFTLLSVHSRWCGCGQDGEMIPASPDCKSHCYFIPQHKCQCYDGRDDEYDEVALSRAMDFMEALPKPNHLLGTSACQCNIPRIIQRSITRFYGEKRLLGDFRMGRKRHQCCRC